MTDEEIAKLKHLREVLDAAPVPEIASLGAHRALTGHDNRLWTPVECLRDAIKDIENGTTPCDKLLVLRLRTKHDDGVEVFDVGYNCAGLRASEIIALLEVAKQMIYEEMGY